MSDKKTTTRWQTYPCSHGTIGVCSWYASCRAFFTATRSCLATPWRIIISTSWRGGTETHIWIICTCFCALTMINASSLPQYLNALTFQQTHCRLPRRWLLRWHGLSWLHRHGLGSQHARHGWEAGPGHGRRHAAWHGAWHGTHGAAHRAAHGAAHGAAHWAAHGGAHGARGRHGSHGGELGSAKHLNSSQGPRSTWASSQLFGCQLQLHVHQACRLDSQVALNGYSLMAHMVSLWSTRCVLKEVRDWSETMEVSANSLGNNQNDSLHCLDDHVSSIHISSCNITCHHISSHIIIYNHISSYIITYLISYTIL